MIVYSICYGVSYALAHLGRHLFSGAVLLLAAGFLYFHDYYRTGNLIHLRGVFSAFWVGGQGIACLKLSRLQAEWNLLTWFCFFLAFAGFWVTFELLGRKYGGRGENAGRKVRRNREKQCARPVFYCMAVVTVVSLAAFILEAAVLGYVPFFVRGVPHAYSEFHLTGVHYLTVSCVLVPALAVLFFQQGGSLYLSRNAAAVVMTVVSLLIPVLCVSRFQLFFAVMLTLFTCCACWGSIKPRMVLAAAALLLPLYVVLTAARSHDVTYLNGIFEMKNSNTPIFISQPYIYIANNYENFSCLIEALPRHTWGIRMLYPLWALTGLKFLFPYLISFPIYVTKTELTTVTLFYDAYYDFGLIGVLLFSCLLGAVCFLLEEQKKTMKNPIGYLLYGQMAVYMMLSFFTTWFSNPTTWFYLIITGIMAKCCCRKRNPL